MRINLKLRTIWTISLVLYIICSTAFSYGNLRQLNTLTLYLFLGVSALNVLKKTRVRLDFFAVTLIAYAVISLFGMLFTPTAFDETWEVMYNYFTMAVLAICVVQYIEDKKDIQMILYTFMIAGLTLALYIYSQYGNSFWNMMRDSVNESFGTVDRLDADLTNANSISLCAAISTIISVYYIFFVRASKWKTIGCLFIAVFCFMVSMAAASKKSLILILSCVVSLWYYSSIGNRNILKKFRSFLLVIVTVAWLIWMIYALPMFSGVARRFEILFSFISSGRGSSSEHARAFMMKEGMEIWIKHPLFGAGTAASIHYLGVYSHNNFVEMLLNSGVLGFGVFYSPYIYAAGNYLKRARYYREMDKLAPLLFALFFGVTVIGFAMVYYYDRYYMLLLAALFSAIRVYNAEIRMQQELQRKKGGGEQ